MRYPKHRATCYLVERVLYFSNGDSFTIVGVFLTPEGADDFKGACIQEFIDKGVGEEHYDFSIVPSTYYSE